jgi:hypothetical protein
MSSLLDFHFDCMSIGLAINTWLMKTDDRCDHRSASRDVSYMYMLFTDIRSCYCDQPVKDLDRLNGIFSKGINTHLIRQLLRGACPANGNLDPLAYSRLG